MSTKNTGGPAFPRPISQQNTTIQSKPIDAQDGMTLRDYFAGQAMQTYRDAMPLNEIADYSYGIADAMLEAREK